MTDGPEIIPNETRQMGHSKVPTWKLQFWYAQFSVNWTEDLDGTVNYTWRDLRFSLVSTTNYLHDLE